ncbi:hypothetical protein RB594_003226 [Gaeumannomyces avenae]
MAKKRSDRRKKPIPRPAGIMESPAEHMSKLHNRKPETKMEKKMRRRYLKERRAEIDAEARRNAETQAWAKEVLDSQAKKEAAKLVAARDSSLAQHSDATASDQHEVGAKSPPLSSSGAAAAGVDDADDLAVPKIPKKLRPSQQMRQLKRRIDRQDIAIANMRSVIKVLEETCKEAYNFADHVERQFKELRREIDRMPSLYTGGYAGEF